MDTLVNFTIKKPKTQKAKGVIFGCQALDSTGLNNCSARTSHCRVKYKKMYLTLIQNVEDIKRLTPLFWRSYKVFARPCPLTPRHGFVDSRVIHNNKELSWLLDEVKAADPEGEILLTNYLSNAEVNAVYCTSGILSIGNGHDGATAGVASISFPVAPEELDFNVTYFSGLNKGDTGFIEAVISRSKQTNDGIAATTTGANAFYLTQVRGGPAVSYAKDFVPVKVKVTNVVRPKDDLLAWEAEVKTFKPGTVVYGAGHTLTSHAAIHCVINNIPFVTSHCPNVGAILKPVGPKPVDIDENLFKRGVTYGLGTHTDISHMLHYSAAIIHNWPFLRTSEQGSWLIGMAAVYFTKVLCALTFGEYRHYTPQSSQDREDVYTKILATDKIINYIKRSPKIAKTFTCPEKFLAGYGGPPWAKAVKAQIRIWNLIADLQNKKVTEIKINKLIAALNRALNLVHNNGWLFNKVSEQPILDHIAVHPGFSLLQFSDLLYQSYNSMTYYNKIKRLPVVSKDSK